MSDISILEEMQQLEFWWNENIKLKIEQGMSPQQAYDSVCEIIDFEQSTISGDKIGRVVHRNFSGFKKPESTQKSQTNE